MNKVLLVLSLLVQMAVLPAAAQPVQADDATEFAAQETLSLYCDHYYLIDRETGQVLEDQASEEQVYPASLTKLMTAVVALEAIEDLNATVTITAEMLDGLEEANATRAGFIEGDAPTYTDLLYGDLMASGADCSRALAISLFGSEDSMVEAMNAKAAELGMTGTHFVNTSGLHDDNHYSTCRDLMTLFLYCLEQPLLVEIMSTETYVTSPVEHYPDGLELPNLVLIYINQEDPLYEAHFDIPGFVCGKSGYTLEGEYTLASECRINGMDLVLVNCHGYKESHYPASIDDASQIYGWYRTHYARQTIMTAGQEMTQVEIGNADQRQLSLAAGAEVDLDLPVDDNLHLVYDLPTLLDAPVTAGQTLGSVSVYAYDRLQTVVDLQAVESVEATPAGIARTFVLRHAGLCLGVLLALLLLLLIIYRARRRKSCQRDV